METIVVSFYNLKGDVIKSLSVDENGHIEIESIPDYKEMNVDEKQEYFAIGWDFNGTDAFTENTDVFPITIPSFETLYLLAKDGASALPTIKNMLSVINVEYAPITARTYAILERVASDTEGSDANFNNYLTFSGGTDEQPDGWTDDPMGISEDFKYEYVSKRRTYYDGEEKKWGHFSTPAIWSERADNGRDGRDGMDGADGNDGANGLSVSSVTEYYQATMTKTAPGINNGGWTINAIPDAYGPIYKYLWNYEQFKDQNGDIITTTSPALIATQGKSISAITEYYSVASSSTISISDTNIRWYTSQSAVTPTDINKYLWNYEVVSYDDESEEIHGPSIIGVMGTDLSSYEAPIVRYRGEWVSSKEYVNNSRYIDIVYHKIENNSEGPFFKMMRDKTALGTTYEPGTTNGGTVWESIGNEYEQLATGLLLADDAVIHNLTVDRLKTSETGKSIVAQNTELYMTDDEGNEVLLCDGNYYKSSTDVFAGGGNRINIDANSVATTLKIVPTKSLFNGCKFYAYEDGATTYGFTIETHDGGTTMSKNVTTLLHRINTTIDGIMSLSGLSVTFNGYDKTSGGLDYSVVSDDKNIFDVEVASVGQVQSQTVTVKSYDNSHRLLDSVNYTPGTFLDIPSMKISAGGSVEFTASKDFSISYDADILASYMNRADIIRILKTEYEVDGAEIDVTNSCYDYLDNIFVRYDNSYIGYKDTLAYVGGYFTTQDEKTAIFANGLGYGKDTDNHFVVIKPATGRSDNDSNMKLDFVSNGKVSLQANDSGVTMTDVCGYDTPRPIYSATFALSGLTSSASTPVFCNSYSVSKQPYAVSIFWGPNSAGTECIYTLSALTPSDKTTLVKMPSSVIATAYAGSDNGTIYYPVGVTIRKMQPYSYTVLGEPSMARLEFVLDICGQHSVCAASTKDVPNYSSLKPRDMKLNVSFTFFG